MKLSLNQPLHAKHILVTGIRDQSLYRFVKQLTDYGAEVEVIPLIEIRFLSVNFDEVTSFNPDWIFFTSKNAVKAFYKEQERLALPTLDSASARKGGISTSIYNGKAKIAVIGPSTEQTLNLYGEEADFISPKANAQAAVQAFLEHISIYPEENPKPLVLWPCGNRAYPDLALGLLSAGCTVYPLIVYETLDAHLSELEKAKIKTQKWDSVVLGSASAVQAYAALLPNEDPETVYACLGVKTKQAVIDAGLKSSCIQGENSHYDSLLEAILS
jgi:uroporphyrinogen-III synthase